MLCCSEEIELLYFRPEPERKIPMTSVKQRLAACTIGLSLLLLLLSAVPSSAADWSLGDNGLKVGVVDMGYVYQNYEEVTKAQMYLQKKKSEFQKEIDEEKYGLREEEMALQKLKERLKSKRLGEQERKAAEREKRRLIQSWQTKFQRLKDKFETYKRKLAALEEKEFKAIRKKIRRAVGLAARRRGVALVLEKQWLYYGNSVDLTDDVLKYLQQED